MSGFSVEWLGLRESYDRRARNSQVLAAVTSLPQSKSAVRLVDLACGAGSTLRTLGPRLPARQHWDLVDNDPRLLDVASRENASNEVSLNTVRLDFSSDIEVALDRPSDLVTISALLDLVSEAWLDRFARHAAARALPVYAALTYDGRIELSPSDPARCRYGCRRECSSAYRQGLWAGTGPFRRHCRDFPIRGARIFSATGLFRLGIGTADQEIQIELLDGWGAAAREMQSLPAPGDR